MSGAVGSRLVMFSVKEDLVDLIGVVRSLWSFPGLGSVFPGAFPESGSLLELFFVLREKGNGERKGTRK